MNYKIVKWIVEHTKFRYIDLETFELRTGDKNG